MKILVIGTDTTLFDENSEARKRVQDYARLFDEYHIIVYTGRGFRPTALVGSSFVYPTNSRSVFFRPLNALHIAGRIIRERGIDIISVQDPAESGLAGWILKKRFGCQLHVQVHSDFLIPYFRRNSIKEYSRYMMAKFILPRGDKFRVVSRRIADSLHATFRIPYSKIKVLPIFVDRGRMAAARPSFDLRRKYPQFNFIMLMVSRLVREKNFPLALRAFRDFLKEFPKGGLVIVGDGPECERLKSEIRNQKLEDSVCLEGWQDDLLPYYKGADLYLLTSNFEGYGRSVIEAVAAGCPVVMTNVGVASEIITDGEAGQVVRVNDRRRLVRVLLQSRQNPQEIKRMAEKAKQKVLRLPPTNWDEYLEEYRQSFL